MIRAVSCQSKYYDRMATESPWLTDEEQELWQALLTIVIALPSALDRQLLRDAAISNFEYSVLARLSIADDATMRLGDLARVCDGTLPRLSKVMDRLASRGWVVRSPDVTDGRYTLATLTAAGRTKVVASAPEHVAKVKQLIFAPLSAAQRRNLAAGLARIAATVRAEIDPS